MKKTKYKNIIFEYELSDRKEGKAIIALGSLPGTPKYYNIFQKFIENGYDVFYPQYEGTWESEGKFLERPPAEAIDELIQYIQKDFNILEFFIVGSSFGGYVALSLANRDEIKKVCALSPVISFQKVVGLETLENYILSEQSENYRFNHDDWQKMMSDQLKSPINFISIPSDKILIAGGIEDDQILIKDLKQFTDEEGIQNFLELNTGHITLSRIDKNLEQDILSFFD